MSRLLFLAGALALAGVLRAQEVVRLDTRSGVSQSFFIADMGARKAEAAALLLIGGDGNINLRLEDGKARFSQGNFLPRARREFIRNGILPVILDNPSDQQAGGGMSDAFRESAAHATDVRAVVAEVKKRHPELPVFLVGTSRSTYSVAHLARALEGEIAGAVLTSSYFYTGGRARTPRLASFDWAKIRTRLLLVHHVDDGCAATPYLDAARVGKRFALVSVEGGSPAQSGPCEPLSQHGYLGREAATVDAIAAWMLEKPFAKEVR